MTWLAGLVAGVLDLEPVWYVFLVLNTLQVRLFPKACKSFELVFMNVELSLEFRVQGLKFRVNTGDLMKRYLVLRDR